QRVRQHEGTAEAVKRILLGGAAAAVTAAALLLGGAFSSGGSAAQQTPAQLDRVRKSFAQRAGGTGGAPLLARRGAACRGGVRPGRKRPGGDQGPGVGGLAPP